MTVTEKNLFLLVERLDQESVPYVEVVMVILVLFPFPSKSRSLGGPSFDPLGTW